MTVPAPANEPAPEVVEEPTLLLVTPRVRDVIEAYRWACPAEPVAYWLARL